MAGCQVKSPRDPSVLGIRLFYLAAGQIRARQGAREGGYETIWLGRDPQPPFGAAGLQARTGTKMPLE